MFNSYFILFSSFNRTLTVTRHYSVKAQSVTVTRVVPATKTTEQASLRQEFWESEKQWDLKLKSASLSEAEMDIVTAHECAIKGGHFTYDDPKTGLKVMTRLRHFLKKTCCGNACRHCIYHQDNVTADTKKTRPMYFNGAFWVPENQVDKEDSDGEEF